MPSLEFLLQFLQPIGHRFAILAAFARLIQAPLNALHRILNDLTTLVVQGVDPVEFIFQLADGFS